MSLSTVSTIQKRSRRSKVDASADFECTTKADDCRVWLWGILNYGDDDSQMRWGTDIDGFMEVAKERNRRVSFHNLRYDGSFIVDWLFKHGFVYVAERTLEANQFKALISDNGKWYSLTIRFDNGVTIELIDSLKKLNMSVAKVAKTFQHPTGKGDIDYHAERPKGYYPSPEEIDYLRRDVGIMADAMHTVRSSGMTKLTIGADSLAEYKGVIGDDMFRRLFPVLSFDMDAEIRLAYRGGFTYADPRFQLKRCPSGIVLDVNSLYPSVMYNELLPYGIPQWQDGLPELTERWRLSVFMITFTAKLKPGHIPCIQIKGSSMFAPAEYLTEISEPTQMTMTNIDFALYQKHYDMDVLSYDGGWRFRAQAGMFKSFIDKYSAIKANSEGGQRELAKLTMNNLYGKFGTNPRVQSKIPYLEDDKVKYERGPVERREPVYTAIAVFVTSYGRALTVTAAQDNYGVFAYADTDSLHLLCDTVPDGLDVHPTRLGAWKGEYHFTTAMYIRAKAYLELKADHDCDWGHCDGEYLTRMAGVPERMSSLLTFDDVFDGHVLDAKFMQERTGDPLASGKLLQKSVPGGVVLVDVPYELKM